jgi:hypothetical protein
MKVIVAAIFSMLRTERWQAEPSPEAHGECFVLCINCGLSERCCASVEWEGKLVPDTVFSTTRCSCPDSSYPFRERNKKGFWPVLSFRFFAWLWFQNMRSLIIQHVPASTVFSKKNEIAS